MKQLIFVITVLLVLVVQPAEARDRYRSFYGYYPSVRVVRSVWYPWYYPTPTYYVPTYVAPQTVYIQQPAPQVVMQQPQEQSGQYSPPAQYAQPTQYQQPLQPVQQVQAVQPAKPVQSSPIVANPDAPAEVNSYPATESDTPTAPIRSSAPGPAYYCSSPSGYYPTVANCTVGWKTVKFDGN